MVMVFLIPFSMLEEAVEIIVLYWGSFSIGRNI